MVVDDDVGVGFGVGELSVKLLGRQVATQVSTVHRIDAAEQVDVAATGAAQGLVGRCAGRSTTTRVCWDRRISAAP